MTENPLFGHIQLHYPTSPTSADTRLSSHLLELDQEGLLRFVGGAHPCLAVTPPGNRSARKIQDMLLELDMQLDFRGLDYMLTTETGESDLRIYPATRYRLVWKMYDHRFFDEPWDPRFRPLSSRESYPPGFFATLGTWGRGLIR